METRKLRFEFPLNRLDVPVFSTLVTQYDINPNVLAGNVNPSRGGWLLIGVSGPAPRIDSALEWVRAQGVTVTDAD